MALKLRRCQGPKARPVESLDLEIRRTFIKRAILCLEWVKIDPMLAASPILVTYRSVCRRLARVGSLNQYLSDVNFLYSLINDLSQIKFKFDIHPCSLA